MANILMRLFIDGQIVLETTSDKHDFLNDQELDVVDDFDFGEDKTMIMSIKEKYSHNFIDYTIKLVG